MSVTAKVRPGLAAVPTHDELVARARELAPVFFERAVEAEKLRRMPDANVAALKKAGLFKVLQARRYGGYQMPFSTHIDVIAEIARGCPSTAWCMGVIHAHSWFMGLFPEKAQEETFGADPDAIISAVIAPRGKAVKVEGGYRLNGFWPFGSGCEHSQWLFLGAVVVDESGKEIDAADFLVPTKEVTLKDDWNVVALRGTGSCSIVAKDVFVPKHRMLSLPGSIAGTYPDAPAHDGWLYKSAVVPVLTLALAPSALGMAEAALDHLKARLPGRIVAYTEGEVQIEQPITHVQVAEAATKIRVARLLLHGCAQEIQAPAERGEMMEFAKRARVRADVAYAVRQCLEAIEILYMATGGSGISESNPMQRAWRDVHAVNMHGLMNLHMNQEMYGRIVLGLKPNSTLI